MYVHVAARSTRFEHKFKVSKSVRDVYASHGSECVCANFGKGFSRVHLQKVEEIP